MANRKYTKSINDKKKYLGNLKIFTTKKFTFEIKNPVKIQLFFKLNKYQF